jgi:hypothetical protein
MKLFAIMYNHIGGSLLDKGKLEKAATYYRRAIRTSPKWSAPWYNLGLVHKKQRDWGESLHCNQTAVQLNPQNKSAWWNLGIAATALSDWPEARRAWTAYGVDMPAGEVEPVMNLGPVPIRIEPQDSGEVVWCLRIDPARAIVKSVPLPESAHRFGDVLLHDGAPNGYRVFQDKEFPVFDELQVLVPSEYMTFEITLQADSESDLKALARLVLSHDVSVEDWSTIRALCHSCSEGKPGEYQQLPPLVLQQPMRLAFAAKSEQDVRSILDNWTAAQPTRKVLGVRCLFGDSHSPTNQQTN